jgi:hypothetical protein
MLILRHVPLFDYLRENREQIPSALGKIHTYFDKWVEYKWHSASPRGYTRTVDITPFFVEEKGIMMTRVILSAADEEFLSKKIEYERNGEKLSYTRTPWAQGDIWDRYANPFLARNKLVRIGHAVKRKTIHNHSELPFRAKWMVRWEMFMNLLKLGRLRVGPKQRYFDAWYVTKRRER